MTKEKPQIVAARSSPALAAIEVNFEDIQNMQQTENRQEQTRRRVLTLDIREATEEQKAKIEQTAQAILDARAKYPDSSFADMYGDKMYLFPELLAAHQENDRAVMQAYGFPVKSSFRESHCVAELFKLYQELTKQE